MILCNSDTKCNWLERALIVFHFYISLFYLKRCTFLRDPYYACRKSHSRRGLTFVKELHTVFLWIVVNFMDFGRTDFQKLKDFTHTANVCKSAKLHALRAFIPTCLACLLSHVPTCLWYLRAHVPTCLACLLARVFTCQRALHGYVLACQRSLSALSTYVLTC